MTVILILLSIVFFLIGFLFGALRKPYKKGFPTKKSPQIKSLVEEEYQNFLEYDGSEQM